MSVRIPQDSERSGLVRIEGDPKGVQLARRELIEMVQRMVSTSHTFTVICGRKRKRLTVPVDLSNRKMSALKT